MHYALLNIYSIPYSRKHYALDTKKKKNNLSYL